MPSAPLRTDWPRDRSYNRRAASRVVIVGDSVAYDLAPLLDLWGTESDVWDVASHALIGCGILRGGSVHGLQGDTAFEPECQRVARRLGRHARRRAT